MSRASLFADVPHLICAQLRDRLDAQGALDIQPHPGRFTVEELRRSVLRGVGVRVALIGATPGASVAGPEFPVELRLAAMVVVSGGVAMDRIALAATLTQAVATVVQDFDWGDPDLGPARLIGIDNLYSGAARDAASLWGLGWAQPAHLDRSVDAAEIALTEILGSFDPAADAADFETIIEVEP